MNLMHMIENLLIKKHSLFLILYLIIVIPAFFLVIDHFDEVNKKDDLLKHFKFIDNSNSAILADKLNNVIDKNDKYIFSERFEAPQILILNKYGSDSIAVKSKVIYKEGKPYVQLSNTFYKYKGLPKNLVENNLKEENELLSPIVSVVFFIVIGFTIILVFSNYLGIQQNYKFYNRVKILWFILSAFLVIVLILNFIFGLWIVLHSLFRLDYLFIYTTQDNYQSLIHDFINSFMILLFWIPSIVLFKMYLLPNGLRNFLKISKKLKVENITNATELVIFIDRANISKQFTDEFLKEGNFKNVGELKTHAIADYNNFVEMKSKVIHYYITSSTDGIQKLNFDFDDWSTLRIIDQLENLNQNSIPQILMRLDFDVSKTIDENDSNREIFDRLLRLNNLGYIKMTEEFIHLTIIAKEKIELSSLNYLSKTATKYRILLELAKRHLIMGNIREALSIINNSIMENFNKKFILKIYSEGKLKKKISKMGKISGENINNATLGQLWEIIEARINSMPFRDNWNKSDKMNLTSLMQLCKSVRNRYSHDNAYNDEKASEDTYNYINIVRVYLELVSEKFGV